jgi:hypothetical protein
LSILKWDSFDKAGYLLYSQTTSYIIPMGFDIPVMLDELENYV